MTEEKTGKMSPEVMQEKKREVLLTAKKAYDEKLMAGTSGNMSVYCPDCGLMAITPSSYDYSIMEEKDIVVIDLDGNVIEGCHRPSSEWKMHAEIYRHLPRVGAIVHTHSPYATSFAVTHQEIPVILIEMIPFLKGSIEVSPYATQGSAEVGLNAVPTSRAQECLPRWQTTVLSQLARRWRRLISTAFMWRIPQRSIIWH